MAERWSICTRRDVSGVFALEAARDNDLPF